MRILQSGKKIVNPEYSNILKMSVFLIIMLSRIKNTYRMKKQLILLTLIFTTIISLNYSSGPASVNGQAYTGAPGESGTLCSSCHSANSFGVASATLTVMDGMGTPVTTYTAGETYQISLTAVPGSGSPSGYGFQLTVLDGGNNDLANFSNPSANAKISTATNVAGGRTYAEHNSTSATSTFTVDWVAPAEGTGDLTFYYNVNVVNGNGGTSGDSGGAGFSTAMSETPTPKVKVVGALEINNAFTFPTTDGTANQVLTTDGMGNVSWMDNAAFTGGNSTNQNLKSGQNPNEEIISQKKDVDNLKNEVILLKSEIEALKKLINKLTEK